MIDSLIGFDAVLALLLVAVAVGTLISRELFQATVMFIVFGLLMALAWCRLEAVDVALAEAAIGAGLTGALLLNTLGVTRRSGSESVVSGATERQTLNVWELGSTPYAQRRVGIAVLGSAALMTIGLAVVVIPLAAFEDDSEIAPAERLPPSGVENPVTAVLLNFRAYDTLLEVAVLVAAVWAVLPLATPAERFVRAAPLGPVLTTFTRSILPPAVLVATFVLWVGTKSPGGAFQAAAMLAAVAVLLMVCGTLPPTLEPRRWRFLLIAGLAGFLLVAVEGVPGSRHFLEYRSEWAGASITLIEVGLSGSIALVLIMLFGCTSPTGKEYVSPDAAGSRVAESSVPEEPRS